MTLGFVFVLVSLAAGFAWFCSAAEVKVYVEMNDHLRLEAESTVLIQSVDMVTAMNAVSEELRELSSTLGLRPLLPPSVSTTSLPTPECVCANSTCSPGFRHSSGVATCCAASAGTNQCRWTERCNPVAYSDRQTVQRLQFSELFRVPVSTEGLFFSRSTPSVCPAYPPSSSAASASSFPIAAAAAGGGALFFGATIFAVCFMRRRHRNAAVAKPTAPSRSLQAYSSNPLSAVYYSEPSSSPEYEVPDSSGKSMEMTAMRDAGTRASVANAGSVDHSDDPYSRLGQQRSLYAESGVYTPLDGRHATYRQTGVNTGNIQLPGQVAALSSSALMYEEPAARSKLPDYQVPGQPDYEVPVKHNYEYHEGPVAGSSKTARDDYVDILSKEDEA